MINRLKKIASKFNLRRYNEEGFLTQLKGLPIEEARLSTPGPDAVEARATQAGVAAAAGRVDDDLATQTYRAWLMAGAYTRPLLSST
jgi:hypothetical protein